MFSPAATLVLGWGLYGALFALSTVFIEYRQPVDVGAIAYIILTSLALYGGIITCKAFSWRHAILNSCGPPRRFIRFTMILGVCAFFLRFFDRIVLRGVEISAHSVGNRDILINSDPTIFGVFGAILFGFSYAPFIVISLYEKDGARFFRWEKSVSLLLFFMPILDAMLAGKRIQIFIPTIIFSLLYLTKKKTTITRMFYVIFIASIAIIWGVLIYAERVIALGFDLNISLYHSTYAAHMEPEIWVYSILSQNDFYSQVLAGFIHLVQYYLHGLFQYFFVFDALEASDSSNGALLFGVFYKLFHIIGLIGTYGDDAEYLVLGTYTTFWGPLYCDFGWVGILYMFLLGLVAQYCYVKAFLLKKIFYAPLSIYMGVIIFFMPVVNLIAFGLGLFIISSFVILVIINRLINEQAK